MQIEPDEKIYKRTDDRDIYLEWRLVSVKISLRDLEERKLSLERQIESNPEPVTYPYRPSPGQISAIDHYNKAMVGPVALLKDRLTEVSDLINILTHLP